MQISRTFVETLKDAYELSILRNIKPKFDFNLNYYFSNESYYVHHFNVGIFKIEYDNKFHIFITNGDFLIFIPSRKNKGSTISINGFNTSITIDHIFYKLMHYYMYKQKNVIKHFYEDVDVTDKVEIAKSKFNQKRICKYLTENESDIYKYREVPIVFASKDWITNLSKNLTNYLSDFYFSTQLSI